LNELSHEPVLQQFPDAVWDEAAGAVILPLGQARAVAEWLLGQGVDYCSNVTGVDYLEREVKELRRANEILRKASAYFAMAELDRRER